MPKITELYAFIMEDTGPDDEGVVGMKLGDSWMPLVGADMDRVKDLKPIAVELAADTGKKITLAKFSTRTDVEIIQ